MLGKANKLKAKLDNQKKQNQEAIDRLNSALLINQKLEEYISFPGDVLNKAKLFDNNMVKNPVSATKVIPILVDFVEKMEELQDDMRSLFNGLAPESNPAVPLENVLDISGDILSLTGWAKESAPTEAPTKPDQPKPSEPTREMEEEEVLPQTEYKSLPRRVAQLITTRREILVGNMVERVIEELEGERNQPSRSETPHQLARIDIVQIGPEEEPAEQIRELPTPPEASTPEPTTMARPMPRFLQTPIPTFISKLERATTPQTLQSPFKMPWSILVRKFPINLVQSGGSSGPEVRQEPELSGSGKSSGGEADVVETSSRAAQVTRSIAKQTPGEATLSLPKRPILSPTTGSSSKRPKN